jgi:anti-anti-sigma factor
MSTADSIVEIQKELKGEVLIFRIRGRLDAISTPLSEKAVFEEINQGRHRLILDFSQVDYISSAGMRMLLSATKKLKSLSGKVIVASVTSNVMDVLKMSGFDHVLDLAKNEDDALRKF